MSPSQAGGPLGEWIEEAHQGSADALGRLLEQCRQYLLLIANQQLCEELRGKVGASDLVQDTFLEAQRDFARFHGRTEDELRAWLRRLLLNNLANLRRHYRAGKRETARDVPLAEAPAADLLGPLADPSDSPSGKAVARERDEALQQALARLPERYRQVIQWHSYDRLPFEEVGRRLGKSAEAARKLWARAIEQLQQALEPADEPSEPEPG